MTQVITKENIAEVLKFNNLDTRVKVCTNSLIVRDKCTISIKSENWLDILEAALTLKLEPLPAFDFEKYLLEKDIVVDDDIAFEIVIDKKHTIHCNNGVKRNKANADRLIAAANMLGELE